MNEAHGRQKAEAPSAAEVLASFGPAALTPTVLHIDDDPNDAELLKAAARKAQVPFIVQNVEDADAAIAYFRGTGVYADRLVYGKPSLVLLDLKMPRTTGFELLKWMRSQPDLKSIPVVVLSGSELKDDIQFAYENGANSYLVKPLSFEALVELVGSLNSLWLKATGGNQGPVGSNPR